MPEEATSGDKIVDGGERIVLKTTYTDLPKATADMSRFTKIWNIDLEKFKIKNDGSVVVSDELNAALQYAKEQGYNRIVFPKGKYLIAHDKPILLDHKNTIIDLNGAELAIEPNGKQQYNIVEIIINNIIHNRKTPPSQLSIRQFFNSLNCQLSINNYQFVNFSEKK